MKRRLVRVKESRDRAAGFRRRRGTLREEGRSVIDLQALEDVQYQADSLTGQMMAAKTMLAGLAVGSDEVDVSMSRRV
jgi:hypothetical protein